MTKLCLINVMVACFLFVLLFLIWNSSDNLTLYLISGACPDNREPGERWTPLNTCMECFCDHGGYGCMGYIVSSCEHKYCKYEERIKTTNSQINNEYHINIEKSEFNTKQKQYSELNPMCM